MKLRTKIILTFSMIFIIAFATLSYNAHTAIELSLLNSGLSDELVASILSEVGISTLIISTIIGIGAVLVVFWVSSRIALPIRKLDSQLKLGYFILCLDQWPLVNPQLLMLLF